MADIVAQRRELRARLRARRAALDPADQAAAAMAVVTRLARMPLVRGASTVAGYRAVRGEVDIDAALVLLAEGGSTVTVPRVNGEHLEFVPWQPDQAAAPGAFGIPEPIDGGVTVPLARHEVVLAPLVAFDLRGNRLGQGGGYYDRALASLGDRRPVVIGIAHSFQEVAEVPTEPWDVPLDAVVTEEAVTEFRPGSLGPRI